MKDEYGGVIIDQFIGLKSKMYSVNLLLSLTYVDKTYFASKRIV